MSFKYELLNKGTDSPVVLYSSPKSDFIKDVKRDLPTIQYLALTKAEKFNNITDMFNYYYNDLARLKLQKADDPFLTSTTGVINPIYGQEVMPQFSLESNGIALANKMPYQKTGIRVQTARAFTAGSGGLGEGLSVAIPDSVKPTYQLVKMPLKTIAHVINWSLQVAIKSKFDDSIVVPANVKSNMMAEHIKCQNEMSFVANSTLAGNNLESLRRLVSSYDEINTYGYTSGNVDPWTEAFSGINRDGGQSWADANVLMNSGTPRDVSLALLKNMIRLSATYDPEGFNPNNYYFLTNLTQKDKISALLQAQQRFVNVTKVTVNQNGVTRTGVEGGYNVISYEDIPIFYSVDAPDEIMLINKKHLWMQYALPPMAFDYGLLQRGDPSGLNALGDETLLLSMGEWACDNFRVQSKLMDLTT